MKKVILLVISLCLLIVSCKSNISNNYSDTHIVINEPERYEGYEDYLSLIAEGRDINAIDEEGNLRGWEGTPLTMAVCDGYIDIVEKLLSKGADINGYDGIGKTPLLTAIEICDYDMVELLVNNGADVNKRSNQKDAFLEDTSYGEYGEEAPINIACRNGIKPIVELLIKNGADVNSQYDNYRSAINDAYFIAKDKSIVKMLIDAGAEVTIHDYTFIGDIEEVKASLKRNKNLNNQTNVVGYTPLHIAALEGDNKIAQLLIESGADINVQNVSGVTPLMYAVMESHNEVAKLLIDSNAVLDIESHHGRNALCYTAEENNNEIKEYLVAKGAEINIDAAVMIGDIERTKALIDSGIDLNKTISGYGTLLTLAVHFGQIEIAQLLIDNGMDVNKGWLEHQYPIVQGIETNNEDMVKMLLKNGAAIDLRETTALHIASRMGLAKMAEILIDNGADVNAKDIDDTTPLYEACYYGDIKTVKLLLDCGAVITSVGIINESIDKGNTELVRLLLENGEDVFLKDNKTREKLISRAIENGYTDIVELFGGNAEQISNSKSNCPYSIIITNPESVREFLEFREIPFDRVWIPDTKLIKEIDLSISHSIPPNNYVGKKALYTDTIHNRKLIRDYCKEYSGFIFDGSKYIVCNMIQGKSMPHNNKFHRIYPYEINIMCFIVNTETMEIVKLLQEPLMINAMY